MDKKIAFIGGGNMAEAVLSGLLRKQVVGADDILVSEKLPERRAYLEKTHHVETTEDNAEAAKRAGTVFLAVKPQMLAQVQEALRSGLTEDHLVISILAGITRERLGKALGR
ncbi:MAG: NAD(P)-binding domain-containing protein, partial [Candidatus Omnitrophica bacterium]|nr:NAD(P)-binding domain-containing protein [Candidatus Omnitrophota bacterium]